jgi:multiple sugar transport system ATP-binding protein
MAGVELRNITKRFGKVTALDDVSLKVRDGEFFCVLGPSGAGKTTLINVACGVENPQQGMVLIGEADVTRSLPQERDIATAFESYALYPHFTVYQNLAFPLNAPQRRRDISGEQKSQRVHEVARMLGIEELLARFPRELSGGQKQRVALGRTLVRRPKAYMLDEPIAHLDAKLRHRMRAELKKIQQELAITTLYSTPDQLEALSMGDTIAVLNAGKIEQVGTADELYYSPANMFVAQFVGDPPMNILEADYLGSQAVVNCDPPYKIPLPERSLPLLAGISTGGKLMIGIRSRDVRVVSAQDPSAHMKGEVVLIDTLGQVAVVTARISWLVVKAKIGSDTLPKPGSVVGLSFDLNQLYYFDPATNRAIR